MSESKTITACQENQKWAEARGGQPVELKGTEDKEESERLLHIRFSDKSKDSLKAIGWDKFFKTFEDKKLAFLHQDKSADNKERRFFKFVKR